MVDEPELVFLSTGGAGVELPGAYTVKWTRNGAALAGGVLQLAGECVRAGRERARAVVDLRPADDRRDGRVAVERDVEQAWPARS